jgi:transposase
MSGKRYAEEFKIEAVKQVTDRGYKIGEVRGLLVSRSDAIYALPG